MTKLLISIFLFPSLCLGFGPGVSGGGAPGPKPCRPVVENISLGRHLSKTRQGWGKDDVVSVGHNLVRVTLTQKGGIPYSFSFVPRIDRAGRISGKSFLGSCEFEVSFAQYDCHSSGRADTLIMMLSFWLSEYLYSPESFQYSCRRAQELHRDSAASSLFFHPRSN